MIVQAEETHDITVRYESQQNENGVVFDWIEIAYVDNDGNVIGFAQTAVQANPLPTIQIARGSHIQIRAKVSTNDKFYGIKRSDGFGGIISKSYPEGQYTEKTSDAGVSWGYGYNATEGKYVYYDCYVYSNNTIELLSYNKISFYGDDVRLTSDGKYIKSGITYNSTYKRDWEKLYSLTYDNLGSITGGTISGDHVYMNDMKDTVGWVSKKEVFTNNKKDVVTDYNNFGAYTLPSGAIVGTPKSEYICTDLGQILHTIKYTSSIGGAVTESKFYTRVYDNRVTIIDTFPDGTVKKTLKYVNTIHNYPYTTDIYYDGYSTTDSSDCIVSTYMIINDEDHSQDSNVIRRTWVSDVYNYTITYDPNGGSGFETTHCTYNQPFTISNGSSFSNNGIWNTGGHKLIGWSLTPNGSVNYSLGQSINSNLANTNNENIILYAVWQDIGVPKIDSVDSSDKKQITFTSYDFESGIKSLGIYDNNNNLIQEVSVVYSTYNPAVLDGFDYGRVFDYQYYYSHNPDVVNSAYSTNVFNHFGDMGMNESRQGNEQFNLSTYRKYNQDIVNTFGSDNISAYQHYCTSGYKESRVSREIQITFTFPNGYNSDYHVIASDQVGNKYTLLISEKNYNYTIKFNSNGGTGTMSDFIVDSISPGILPMNNFKKETADGKSKFLGWNTLSSTKTAPIPDQGTPPPGTANSTIVLYAIWDDCPQLYADDYYVTLQEAQEGLITSSRLLERAFAQDDIDGVISNHVTIQNFDPGEFTQFTSDGSTKITYQVIDSGGNETAKTVTIFIVNTDSEIVLDNTYVRFINADVYTKSFEEGGLETDSIWRMNSDYAETLSAAMDNRNSLSEQSGTVNLLGINYSYTKPGSISQDHLYQSWTLSSEDITQIKEYINTHGFGNLKERNGLSNFITLFTRCTT